SSTCALPISPTGRCATAAQGDPTRSSAPGLRPIHASSDVHDEASYLTIEYPVYIRKLCMTQETRVSGRGRLGGIGLLVSVFCCHFPHGLSDRVVTLAVKLKLLEGFRLLQEMEGGNWDGDAEWYFHTDLEERLVVAGSCFGAPTGDLVA